MKLISLKNIWVKDSIREKMVVRKKGEAFEMDPDKEGQEIYVLLQAGQISIVDDKYVLKEAAYIGTRTFSEQRENGTWLRITPGQRVVLSQAEACRLMVSDFVRPENEKQWQPQRLITGAVSNKPAKAMFDEVEVEPKVNWAKNYTVRRGID